MSLKDENAVRYAIWNAYKRRCQITKNLIENITDMEIDHIISVSTFKDKKKVAIYNLPEDFDLHGLENLRPVLRAWNREKSNQELPSEQVNLNLLKARNLKKLVEREITKYHEEKQYALSIEVIREAIRKKDIALEEYVDQIRDYQVDYGYEVISNENNFINSIEVNSHSVRISAHLPRVEEREGNCLFSFNSFYLRQVNITLSHQEILRTLYRGHKTPLELSMRSYIMVNTLSNEFKTYIISIGGCVFHLDIDEVKHLIRAIDIFIENYVEAIKNIECKLESKNFYPMLHDLNNYKLICILPDLFEKIILFTRDHDYSAGESEWHIFDANGTMIKVYEKDSGKYRCFLYAISDNNDGFNWYNTHSNVWLVWDYMNIAGEDLWSAQSTFRWLIEDLIPAVEVYFNTPTKFSMFKKKQNGTKINATIYTNKDKFYDIKTKVSKSKLFKIGESLQLMYSIEKQFYMQWSSYINIYDAILYLVRICPSPDYPYISSKLCLGQVVNKEDLLRNINQEKEKENKGKIYSEKLDLLFRIFTTLVRDSLNVLKEEEISKLISLIEEPINTYNTVKLVESQYKV
ncbi:hypothetical protein [Niallia sp. 03133]|uniref:hypothetical protein n=1 Tax=Niallia sp. 03133 TaxID=3458060 RepID=UPI004044A541